MVINDIAINKRVLRKEKLQLRQGLDEDYLETASEEICNKIINSTFYHNSKSILLYCDYNNEVQTSIVFNKAIEDNKTVAFPKCYIKDHFGFMEFYIVNDLKQLTFGYKGIREPDIDNYELQLLKGTADLCILPCSVFDEKCHRIGYGKGFYDRYLLNNKCRTTIAIAFEIQKADCFEIESTDINTDFVYTDKCIYKNLSS